MSDYLPEEVVLEILHRLPVKSLIRFRCVSRSWNSLITSSAFINSRLTRSLSLPSNSNNLIVRHCVDNSYVNYFKLIDDKNDSFDQIQNIELPRRSRRIKSFVLIGSVNGLFSLYEQHRYILWNPSIRKCITLPRPCITSKTHGSIGFCRQAFGFDPRTNDYKLVRIAFPSRINMSEEAKPPLIEVYSLNEGCWRVTSTSFPPGITFTDWRRPATSLNGAVHFAVEYEYKLGGPCGPLVLLFDLLDEVFHVISLPNVTFKWTNNAHTSVIGGSLSLLFYYYGRHADNKCCAIWVMKEYGVVDSWTKQFTVNLNGGVEIIRVLGLQKNGNILVEAILSGPCRCELSSYDPKSEQVKNLGICGSSYNFHVDNYMENLSLLDKPNETVSERRVSRKSKCRYKLDLTQNFSIYLSQFYLILCIYYCVVVSKHEVPNLNILFSDVNLLSKEWSEFLSTILLFCMLELVNINERLTKAEPPCSTFQETRAL
ncbi:F-box/kelch-repeat protein At3g23880-like [Quercus lobata]|uniref:F-box domain-containing protein n=1 Tax=Quercus lobata TaxID=97700 RepID=A0A7N2R2N0_QUELO|nr:F-box/kelch-repeat protein At3g23880-like [Quercus lobata]XP_030967322.1 F-box/kelch-repeat protein At3g23880-like [Quercus lobata]